MAYHTGLIAAQIVNTSMAAPRKPVTAVDFFPELAGNKSPRKKRINRRAVANGLKAALKAMAKRGKQ